MKEKNAFTLIELLAVFVILTIIATITVPIVLNLISNAREQSNKRSIEGYVRAIENEIANYRVVNRGKNFPTSWSDFESSISVKGSTVSCKTIKINGITVKPTNVNTNESNSLNNNDNIELGCCTVNGGNKYYKYENNQVSLNGGTCD